MAKLDLKYLEGKVFKSATEKIVEKDGRKRRTFIPTERPLTEDDVLAWADYGDYIGITAKDGQHYDCPKIVVKKKEEPKI